MNGPHNPAPQSARGASLEDSSSDILSQKLWLKILIGMVAGVAIGLALSPRAGALISDTALAATVGEWVALPGILFLGLIKLVIIPLIFSSIILGIAQSGTMASVRQLGVRIVPYFFMTTAIAITIGIVLVNIIQPGGAIDMAQVEAILGTGAATGDAPAQTLSGLTIPQRIENIIPDNLPRAMLEGDMLQIVIAAILTGAALLAIPQKTAKPAIDLSVSAQVLSMKIISWAMVVAPYAVFGLLCNITLAVGWETITMVGRYTMTVLAGLGCMVLVYMLIVAVLARRSPGSFLAAIREVQLLAFSTSSSAATMPFSIQAAEEKLDIRKDISRFVIPLGATINMDGTAMYQAIAALFLCQVFGIELTMTETVLLLLTTVGASIGTPATPGVGLVVLATILVGIGVPPQGIALIIGVDRLLDMCRTTVNVTGDLTASTVMQAWLPEKPRDETPAPVAAG